MTDSRPIRATARRRAEPPAEMPVEAFLDLFPPPMRSIDELDETVAIHVLRATVAVAHLPRSAAG